MKNQAKFDFVTSRAPKSDPEVGGDYTGCRGRVGHAEVQAVRVRHCSTTPISRSSMAAACSAPASGRTRGEAGGRHDRKVSLLADGLNSKDSEIKDGYPEFNVGALKKLGWDKDLTEAELAVINKINPDHPGRGFLVDRPVGRRPARRPEARLRPVRQRQGRA